MTKQQIDYSIKTKKLPYTFWQLINHFYPVIVIGLIPIIFSGLYISGKLSDLPSNISYITASTMLILFALSIFLFTRQLDRLKFKTIANTLTRHEVEAIVRKVADELAWNIETINERFIVARTEPGFFSGSYGELITILIGARQVLINSVCDPDKTTSVVSMGRNKKNEERLIEEIKKANIKIQDQNHK